MTNWQPNDLNQHSQGSPQPINGDPAPSGPTVKRRWLLPTLVAVAVVVAAGAGVAGSAIGYANGEHTSAAAFAARPTPTATVTATATVVKTLAPKTVVKTETETETETETATPEAPVTLSLEGSIEIDCTDNWERTSDGCEGASGYSDLSIGAPVIVYDGTNNNAGAGSLEKAEVLGTSCKMSFSISDVVGGSNVYLVEVASRGKLKAELIGGALYYSGTIGK